MSITRKWAIARVEHIDDDGVNWIAETRAGTGTWVIREGWIDNEARLPFEIVGDMFPFPAEPGLLLTMSVEQRAKLHMSDDVYQLLNVELRIVQIRTDEPLAEIEVRASLAELRRRVERLEGSEP
jgi:hypothetical protein